MFRPVQPTNHFILFRDVNFLLGRPHKSASALSSRQPQAVHSDINHLQCPLKHVYIIFTLLNNNHLPLTNFGSEKAAPCLNERRLLANQTARGGINGVTASEEAVSGLN